MELNSKLFLHTSLASSMLLLSHMAKNSATQFGPQRDDLTGVVGLLLYAIAWAYLIYALTMGRTDDKWWYIIPGVLIWMSAMFMRFLEENGKRVPIIHFVYIAGWFVLGYAISKHLTDGKQYLGLTIGACTTLAMGFFLPKQRKNCTVDGPGLPIFMLGCVMATFLNSYGRT